MAQMLPYMTSATFITSLLTKIKEATVPERFSKDFIEKKLLLKSSNARGAVSFMQSMGFITSDGTPTDLYKQFRGINGGSAAAAAMKIGYKALFEMIENAHQLQGEDLKRLIIESTGEDKDSRVVQFILNSFKAFLAFAEFNKEQKKDVAQEIQKIEPQVDEKQKHVFHEMHAQPNKQFAISYTFNLNLPSTDNQLVYKAIFQALKEHLLND